MPKTSQMMAACVPVPPSSQLLSSSQYSEAISIVSPSEYLAARQHPLTGNTSRQSPTTVSNKSAHQHADDNQAQSRSHSNPSSPTQPIYIVPRRPRRRNVERLAPLGLELSKGHVEPIWQQPLPGQIHHRADEVKNYHLMGTCGWEGFQQRRLAISQAEIGRIDPEWVANGGGVIRDFGVKKKRRREGKVVQLSTIVEEEEEDEEGEEGDGDRKDERGSGERKAGADAGGRE